MDPSLSKFVAIGQSNAAGQFDVLLQVSRMLPPLPWSLLLNESFGKGCDHADPSKGGCVRPQTHT